MTQPLYIISSSSISPQHTYDAASFLHPLMEYDNGKLPVIDPDYSRYIGPVPIRRMSRILKRGITAGMRALEEADVTTPDAIIIGTAHGSITDMELFIKDMIRLEEEAMNPTFFIQSTYNSVNGWLAMLTKCNNYNQTFVHRGFSLELCLFDARLLFGETEESRLVLVGAYDELTDDYYTIRKKIQYFKEHPPRNTALFDDAATVGTIAGEGAHFFAVSNRPDGASCAVHGIDMLKHAVVAEIAPAVAAMLAANDLDIADIDVLLSGMNGSSSTADLASTINDLAAPGTTIAVFKHLCGEYHTAAGFGMWLAQHMFKEQRIPAETVWRQGEQRPIRNVLICNITIAGNVSILLLRAV